MSKTDLALSLCQPVPKKYPRRAVVYPPASKPAHNDILCTDSKGNQAKQDKHGGGVPLPPFLRPSLPALTFPRSALTEQGAKTIAYNQSKNESKRNKQTRQKAKEKGKPIILYSTHPPYAYIIE